MRQTTLCYIENPRGEYLMLHRVKKKNDANHDKSASAGNLRTAKARRNVCCGRCGRKPD